MGTNEEAVEQLKNDLKQAGEELQETKERLTEEKHKMKTEIEAGVKDLRDKIKVGGDEWKRD